MTTKFRSISFLTLAQVFAMSLWFVSAAILPDMLKEFDISVLAQAALTSAVPAGFVSGALLSALLVLPDRYDPRYLFALSVVLASLSTFLLLFVEPGSLTSVLLRFVTGFMLAGIYPVGMKIAVGWGTKDRGFLVGLLVGALTIGSAMPHLVTYLGGAEWRSAIWTISGLSLISAVLIAFTKLGPYHTKAPSLNLGAIFIAWTNKKVRYAYLGYFGHMWELYAMWSWIGIATYASYLNSMDDVSALSFAKLTAFLCIAVGGVACMVGGYIADRIGKANVTIYAMMASGSAAFLTAMTFGGAPVITFVLVLFWGFTIIPDSPQFSALVADHAPAEFTGSLLSFQTAIGFALTIFTVQLTPFAVELTNWPTIIAVMGLGPLFGVYFMRKIRD